MRPLPESGYLAGKDVYIDGFSYFNRVEGGHHRRDAAAGAQRDGDAAGDDSDTQLFRNGVEQRRRLQRMAKEHGCKCEVINLVSCDNTALGHLERHFFGTDEPWEGDTPPITLYQAHTAYSEVEYVSAQLRRLAQGGVRWRDMAVAARNMEVYGPLFWRRCSGGTGYRPTSAAAATFWSSRC